MMNASRNRPDVAATMSPIFTLIFRKEVLSMPQSLLSTFKKHLIKK